MSKRIFSFIGFVALMVLLTGILSAAAPAPTPTFTLVQGLPDVMNIGDTYNVIIRVDSDQPFIFAQALPAAYYPGRGLVAAQGDHVGQGNSATLSVPFYAKTSTADFPGGVVPVSVSVGVRYSGGAIAVQQYSFTVQVP